MNVKIPIFPTSAVTTEKTATLMADQRVRRNERESELSAMDIEGKYTIEEKRFNTNNDNHKGVVQRGKVLTSGRNDQVRPERHLWFIRIGS